MKAVLSSLPGALLMDTGIAAIRGALLDSNAKLPCLAVNIGDGGHGCYISISIGIDRIGSILVTGPRRDIMHTSRLDLHFAAPYGDMMLTGCFGLVDGYLKHVESANFYLEIVLSLAVVIVLLKFIQEFNHWNIVYRNSDMFSDILRNVFSEEVIACSCGWKNEASSKFCSKCGSEQKIEKKLRCKDDLYADILGNLNAH